MYKTFAFSFTYLILLILLKCKMLWRYEFLVSRIYDKTAKWMPVKLGWFHPAFYLDDALIAFSMFLIFYYGFQKKSRRISILNFTGYLLVCMFSIISTFVFYKYETPINLGILYQIDSLFTMKTSIDLEILENLRVLSYFIILSLFSISFPLFIILIKRKLFYKKKYFSFSIINIDKYFIVIFLILGSLSLYKNYCFGLEILTDTPVTTFLKSTVKYLDKNRYLSNQTLPEFDDKISNSYRKNMIPEKDILYNQRKKYNVIVILLETTNYEIFSDPQNLNEILPNLSELQNKSIVLKKFYSPYPRSSKSFFATLTGHYPLTSYESIIKSYPHINVPDIFSTMKKNGYKTYAGYSGNFNYDRMADFLQYRGVDKLVDVRDNDGFYKQISWCADDMLIYNQLFSWISAIDKSERFFGLLLPMNSHHPFWTPSPEYKIIHEKTKIDRYKNAIHYQDYLIGKLINFLENTKRLDDTILIVTGDHGPMFNMLELINGSSTPYLINESAVHVPFYLYGPFTDQIGKDMDVIGSHVDILPTILDILDIRPPKKIEGRSLFDVNIKGRINYIYLDYYHHIVNGLTNEFKVMLDFSAGQKILSKTMAFKIDLCSENEKICDELTKKVMNFKEFQNKRIFNKLKN